MLKSLGVALAAVLFSAFSSAAVAADPPAAPEPYTLKQVGPGVWAAIDRNGQSGSNAGFIVGDDGVLVVDSFFNPDSAKALLADIRKTTPLPIRYVVNTHYHIDHVSGDQVFHDAGALIVAQRNVRSWMRTENLKFFGPDPKPEQKTRVEALALPDIGVERDLTLWLGSRRVDVRYVLGHTGGDLVVGAPDARVLFCGDLLWRRIPPNLIDGTLSQWTATLANFEHRPQAASTVFVPGHGDVANVADVAELRSYLQDLVATVSAQLRAGLKGDELAKASVAALTPKYGTWDYFARGAPREVGYVAAELGGTKRTPPQAPLESW